MTQGGGFLSTGLNTLWNARSTTPYCQSIILWADSGYSFSAQLQPNDIFPTNGLIGYFTHQTFMQGQIDK